MTTPAQIDLWRSKPTEYQNLEFKEAPNSYDYKKLLAYCVGMANEGGGHLLLGIVDRAPRPVVGSRAFMNVVESAERIFQKLGFRVEVEEVAHSDGRVVVFTIPSRLRGTAYNLDGMYLMRSGSSLVAMSEDRLRMIFAEGQLHWAEEASRSGLHASDVVALLDTQGFFELLKMPYPTSQAAVIEKLLTDKLIDKSNDGYSIRRIAALLFAKRLTDFPDVARKAPRVIVYDGIGKLKVRRDQPGTRGYAVGFQSLVQYVMAQLPQNEIIKDALRTDTKLMPEDAMRELIANALVHQDLTISGMSPMIEIYENRVESGTCMEGAIFDNSSSCQSSGTTSPGYTCADADEINDAGWSQNCCIFARMTTIAQKTNNFTDGSEFGAISWIGAEVGPYDASGNTPAWNTGGTQSWPNDSTINIVNYSNLANESDTINFHS